MPGIPAELREFFTELAVEPPRPPEELAEDLERHLAEFEHEYRTNEFVDLPGARWLYRQGNLLLVHWDRLTLEERTLAQAAITYFVLTQDVENDFDLDGLSTDKQVMEAVLAHLGIEG